jgi:hemoglobin
VDQPVTPPKTPYEIAGGGEVIEAIVARFYELMASEPAYAELRAIHAEDLAPVQQGLTQFLKAWMGGPKDWFAQGKCVMSLHRGFPISGAIGGQWAEAMQRAIADMLDDFEAGDQVELRARHRKRLDRGGAVVDLQLHRRCVGARYGDILGRRVDARDGRAHARKRLGDQPGAATDIERAQARERRAVARAVARSDGTPRRGCSPAAAD